MKEQIYSATVLNADGAANRSVVLSTCHSEALPYRQMSMSKPHPTTRPDVEPNAVEPATDCLARATEQRLSDRVYKAVAGSIGDGLARKLIEARYEYDDVEAVPEGPVAKLRRISATRRGREWLEAHPEATWSDIEAVDLRGIGGHPLSLANVTIDSALMFPTTARRFLMALWEMEGLRIGLLPRTVQEMVGFVEDSESGYWQRAMRKEGKRAGHKWPSETIVDVAEAAADAARAWMHEELGDATGPPRTRSMLEAITLTPKQKLAAHELGNSIPRRCFRGPSKNDFGTDRAIIGQAIVCGFRILVSDGRSCLRRTALNRWLRKNNHAAEDFVLDADDAIEMGGAWDQEPGHLLEAVLRAALPEIRASVLRETAIVERFLKRLSNEGFKAIAQTCEDEWGGPKLSGIYTRARAYIGRAKTLNRQTGARLEGLGIEHLPPPAPETPPEPVRLPRKPVFEALGIEDLPERAEETVRRPVKLPQRSTVPGEQAGGRKECPENADS